MTITPFRRAVLDHISEPPTDSHAGLWLDKFLKSDDKGDKDRKSAKDQLVRDVAGIAAPKAYEAYFKRWKATLIELCGAENCREAETRGRLAVNLGAEGALETSIALHHTYGTPYIPGSALKGLAAHYVATYFKDDLNKDGDEQAWNGEMRRVLFGDTTSAGYVTFYDALSVPGKVKLVPDVITVHHPEYYQGGDKPPADWDSPTPIPFITATGRFLVALSGPAEWVKAAFEILELALEREGVGAKTSSGYGRMTFHANDAAKETEETFATRKKTLLQENLPTGRLRGTVMDVREGRYGKVNPAHGGRAVRLHINQVIKGGKTLRDGQIVEYCLGKYQGNDQAEDVAILLEPEK
jgi:CRISPR-associated protein Cmr6